MDSFVHPTLIFIFTKDVMDKTKLHVLFIKLLKVMMDRTSPRTLLTSFFKNYDG